MVSKKIIDYLNTEGNTCARANEVFKKSLTGSIDSPLIYNFREICKVSVPTTTYATHGIHPYPAKFIPQIPHFFIQTCSKKGEVVLDPFCGSGTTLVEVRALSIKKI
jgi:DNA modification methylase